MRQPPKQLQSHAARFHWLPAPRAPAAVAAAAAVLFGGQLSHYQLLMMMLMMMDAAS